MATLFLSASGITVGDSTPGSSSISLLTSFSNALNITYLLSYASMTDVILETKRVIDWDLLSSAKVFPMRMASELITVLNSVRLLDSKVAPVDTKSKIRSAIPINGVNSTEP